MINDTGIESEFSYFSEKQFWVRRLVDYPGLAKTVLKILYRSQQPVSVKYYFQVCFKLKLNTEVDSMWKTIFDVLFLQLVGGSRNSQQKSKGNHSIR
jgi:hypothetical protein